MDVLQWLKEIDLSAASDSVIIASLNGKKLITLSETDICSGLNLSGVINLSLMRNQNSFYFFR